MDLKGLRLSDNMEEGENRLKKAGTKSNGLNVHCFMFNPVQENTYLLWDETGECCIIDAGCFNQKEFDKLDQFIRSKNLKPVRLLNTHCHFDHIFGISRCREAYGLDWEAHAGDRFLIENAVNQGAMFGVPVQPTALPEKYLSEGDKVSFGKTTLEVIHVPGHSMGSVCFYDAESGTLITGDVLFEGSIGRTDLPGGDYPTLISGIKTKLMVLPDDVDVYPGHGPSTTIGNERIRNPFLQ